MNKKREEELDIVRSLELTAEGSYDEGYQKGRKAGIDALVTAILKADYDAYIYIDVDNLKRIAMQVKE